MSDNVLNVFINDLNGELPYMDKKEKEEYDNFSNEIKNYEDIIYNCFQDRNDYLI